MIDLVDNPDGIAKVWQELNTRRNKLCFIKIAGEMLNRDIRLKQLHRFSANLNLMFISGANSWSGLILCGHVLSSLGLGLGLCSDPGLLGLAWSLDLFGLI